VNTARYLINNGSENEELTPAQREMVRQQDLNRLDAMERYCKTESCLRAFLLEYFGQKATQLCGNCGTCLGDYEKQDITREAQMILSCAKRIYDRMGKFADITVLARTLRGSRDQCILADGLDQLSTYGLMRTMTRTQSHALIDHLEAEGYLRENEEKGLELTFKAKPVLFEGKQVHMLKRREPEETKAPAIKEKKLSGEDAELYELLKELRAALAKENGVPPFVIFSNATLADMAAQKPRTQSEFRRISGVGELKASWYAEPFTKAIRDYLDG
jgi:ATP-dependent DNA helicase RecQ